MKAGILTFSQTGNTLKVANAIAKGLEKNGISVSQVRFLHLKKWRPDEAHIIGIGCPSQKSGRR
jgi:flavodoxin